MKSATIARKIDEALKDPRVTATYKITDNSTQAELRLSAQYYLRVRVDEINYPKPRQWDHPLWLQMRELASTIWQASIINKDAQLQGITYRHCDLKASARTKSGAAARAQAEEQFRAEIGMEFLGAYKRATTKRNLAAVQRQIAALQAKQMALIPQMRAVNLESFRRRKEDIVAQREHDQEAIKSGHFWEASKETLKNYFHPPFGRNYLADVSERWRAALYTEMGSTAYTGYSGDWRHKLVGTGHAYLCGIDDNGDEWGHEVRIEMGHDQYGDQGYEATVEDAMAVLFGIEKRHLEHCTRQGDLLFRPVTLRRRDKDVCSNCNRDWLVDEDSTWHGEVLKPVELRPQPEPWEIRESHTVQSEGLMRNGEYFASPNEITVTHTSHGPVTLPAGEYRVYRLGVAGAD